MLQFQYYFHAKHKLKQTISKDQRRWDDEPTTVGEKIAPRRGASHQKSHTKH